MAKPVAASYTFLLEHLGAVEWDSVLPFAASISRSEARSLAPTTLLRPPVSRR